MPFISSDKNKIKRGFLLEAKSALDTFFITSKLTFVGIDNFRALFATLLTQIFAPIALSLEITNLLLLIVDQRIAQQERGIKFKKIAFQLTKVVLVGLGLFS